MATRIALLGPPGSGKGTQSEVLADSLGLVHVATGDILRKAVSEGTELGKSAQEFMKRGELVPDDVIIAIVKDALAQGDCQLRGFILDGFPRTLEQARALDAILGEMHTDLDAVLYIEVPEEELVKRLSGRRVCQGCGATYHVVFNPALGGSCPSCSGRLAQRPDDSEQTVRRRLEVYERDTKPLVLYYSERRLLRKVDGTGSIQEVSEAAKKALRQGERDKWSS